VPQVITDALGPGHERPGIGGEAAQRKPLHEGAAGQQHHQENGEKKPGKGEPTIPAALPHTSNGVPSRTALATPSGIEIRYTSSVVHSPSVTDTGSFSSMRPSTGRSR